MAKVLGISGTHRSGGNTTILIESALEVIHQMGIETAFMELCELNLAPCEHCSECSQTGKCKLNDDLNALVDLMHEADGIIIGAPVHYASVPSTTKNMIDRTGRFAHLNGKVGATFVVGRRTGHDLTVSQLLFYLLVKEMIVPGVPSYYVGYALNPGDIRADTEAMAAVRELGRRVGILAQRFSKEPSPWADDAYPVELDKKFGDEWK